MRKGMRFTDGDIWECSACGAWNISGKPCRCGRNLGDQLAEKYQKEVKPKRTLAKKQSAGPVRKGEFIESYLYRAKKEDQNNAKPE